MEGYEIIKPLGSGGNCNAYRGKEIESGRLVTIKSCKGKCFDEIEKRNLANEARMLQELEHEAIPKVYKRSAEEIVLEYIPGNSLEKVLLAKGTFSEKDALKIAYELAGVMRYLHGRRSPVIYRDLKPANIVMKPDGHICLIDYGAARMYERGGHADTLNLGTMGFAAPEQYGNLGQTDPRTDIYCFGKTLLLLLGGKCSPELMEVIDKCIRPDREDRYESCSEIAEALKKYPKRRIRKRVFKVAQLFVAAFAGSAVISFAATHMNAAMSYAASDAQLRVPAVKERMGNAGLRIKEILKENYGVDVDEILAPEGEMDR